MKQKCEYPLLPFAYILESSASVTSGYDHVTNCIRWSQWKGLFITGKSYFPMFDLQTVAFSLPMCVGIYNASTIVLQYDEMNCMKNTWKIC